MLKFAIIVLVLLVLLYLLAPSIKEGFTDNLFQTELEKNMDYIKDSKGNTLNDYVLAKSMLTGESIVSPL